MVKITKIFLFIFCLGSALTVFVGEARAAQIQFIEDAELDLSGLSSTLYTKSGSECDSLTVSGSTLNADVPEGSSFTLGTSNHNVLKLTPSGGTASLTFNTGYLSASSYLSQWTVGSSIGSTQVSY